MRFLHSLLYALFIWGTGILLGSVPSAFIFYLNGDQYFAPDAFDGILFYLAMWSELYSFPVFVILFLSILILNPRERGRKLLIKMILSSLVFVFTIVSFLVLAFSNEGKRFAPYSFIYFGGMLVVIWAYPLKFAAGKSQSQSQGDLTDV
jgi:hypothetical protein